MSVGAASSRSLGIGRERDVEVRGDRSSSATVFVDSCSASRLIWRSRCARRSLLPGEGVLADQDEDRQEDGLERDDQREEAERERIDGAPAGHEPGVPGDPRREPDNVEPREPARAGDPRDGVREALGRGRLSRSLGGLDLGDRPDVSRQEGRGRRAAVRRSVPVESHWGMGPAQAAWRGLRLRRAYLVPGAPAARQRVTPSFSRV